ncbi:MAG: DUF2335 domain-containing protein [Nitrospirae bacterium]|uniref:DUF2335 domain-containing protein n=1 Tax=Candidatus Magnetobacterium casense TaxID=1455061 RepID=UPI00138E3A7E|nr:DUF2335 domain-containing protein [Candidatus Magnetobacterium casensis]MBF0336916.1 DUF2335 domain-containing protein [Nitrospirota bacterium]
MSVQSDSLSIAQARISRHSGPLPAPKTLEGYESILPGSAERILAMAENNLKHKHECDKEKLRQNNDILKLQNNVMINEVKDRKLGKIIALFLIIIGFITN